MLLNDIAGPDADPLLLSLKLSVDVLVSIYEQFRLVYNYIISRPHEQGFLKNYLDKLPHSYLLALDAIFQMKS